VRRAKAVVANNPVTELIFLIEGGRSKTDDIAFRKAFHVFFCSLEESAKQKGIGLQPVFCGSRNMTYEEFGRRLKKYRSGGDSAYPVLLVDSECAVERPGKCWDHLRNRPGDLWLRPVGATDDQCHLMAQAMEAWFFADPAALAEFYGGGFLLGALSNRQDVESIPKEEHIARLEAATRHTSKKSYHKFKHGPELLRRINPSLVRSRAAYCDRIFTDLARKFNLSDLG